MTKLFTLKWAYGATKEKCLNYVNETKTRNYDLLQLAQSASG